MATLGIEGVRLAIVDKDGYIKYGADGINGDVNETAATTKDNDPDYVAGTYLINQDSAYGVASLNLSNLAGSFTDIYGSNRIVYVAQGKASPQAVLTVNALPPVIKARILGQKLDGKGGFELGGKSHVYVAILAESAESFEADKPVYVGMYKMIGQEAALNMQTNNAAENRTQDAITFKAIERSKDGFGKMFHSEVENFDKDAMVKDVFKSRP